MDSVVHFEIPVDDVERAQKFYTETFGWYANSMPGEGYVLFNTCEVDEKTYAPKVPGAINGGMLKRQEPIKNPVITINVDSIDEAHKKIEAAGGKTIHSKPAG